VPVVTVAESVWTVVLFIIAAFGSVCLLFIVVMLGASVVAMARDWRKGNQRPPEEAEAAPQPAQCHCTPHGLEHLCRHDPIDTAALEEIEAHAHATDPRWYARMSRRQGA
jgi:hypothetical protein